MKTIRHLLEEEYYSRHGCWPLDDDFLQESWVKPYLQWSVRLLEVIKEEQREAMLCHAE